MLERGLIDEVRALRRQYRLTATMPSMRSIGYRQVWDVLEGTERVETLQDRAVAATRQLAKRQLTWLRSMQSTVVDCLSARPEQTVADLIDIAMAS